MNIEEIIARFAGVFNDYLRSEILPQIHASADPVLAEPIVYALDGPGKRFRPLLVSLCAGASPDRNDDLLQQSLLLGAAVECIHTYSLIHDDLPAMDNDRLRRGRPTTHIEFGEWKAILAGDALNTFAFELLTLAPEGIVPSLVRTLSMRAGLQGMVNGQALDLQAERDPDRVNEAKATYLERIHNQKTAALIAGACELGATLAGADGPLFAEYGWKLGMLFQISDDILDIEGDPTRTGKTGGRDIELGKWTYPAVHGLEASRHKARDLEEGLVEIASRLIDSPNQEVLRRLPGFVAGRDH